MSKVLEVTLPLVGHAYITVIVDDDASEDDIFDAAESKWNGEFDELNCVQKIVEGNVCYADYPEFIIESITDINEDE